MAEKLEENQFDEVGVNPFNAPVPGESLTSPNNLMPLIEMIDNGTPLDQIAQVVLYRGYTQGLYNPDLMTLLIEPTLYLLISIADYADIKDYILYEGEEDDPDAEIHGDDVEPVIMGEDKEEVKVSDEPKKESLGESLLAKVDSELPAKVRQVKEKE